MIRIRVFITATLTNTRMLEATPPPLNGLAARRAHHPKVESSDLAQLESGAWLEHRIHNPEVGSSSLPSDIHCLRLVISIFELLLSSGMPDLDLACRKFDQGIEGSATGPTDFKVKVRSGATSGASHQ